MIFRKLAFVFLLFSSLVTWSQSTCNLTVTLTGLDSEKGKLFVGVYNTKESFLKSPFKGEILEIDNGKAIAVFKD